MDNLNQDVSISIDDIHQLTPRKSKEKRLSVQDIFAPGELDKFTPRREKKQDEGNLHRRSAILQLADDKYMNQSDIKDLEMLDNGSHTLNECLDIISKCSRRSENLRMQARLYKGLNLGYGILVIAISVAISILSAKDEAYYITFLSSAITFVKLLHDLFQIGKRGIWIKHASTRYQQLKRLLLNVMKKGDISDLEIACDQVTLEIDQIQMNLFSTGYGQTGASKDAAEEEEQEQEIDFDTLFDDTSSESE